MLNLLPGLIKKPGVVSWAPHTWAYVHSFGHKPRDNYSKSSATISIINFSLASLGYKTLLKKCPTSKSKVLFLPPCWGKGDPSRSQRRTGMSCPISRSHFPFTGDGGNKASWPFHAIQESQANEGTAKIGGFVADSQRTQETTTLKRIKWFCIC